MRTQSWVTDDNQFWVTSLNHICRCFQPVPYLSHLEATGIQPGQTVIVKGIQNGERYNNIRAITGTNP